MGKNKKPTKTEIAAYEKAKKTGGAFPIDRAIAIENYFVSKEKSND